MPKVVAKPAKSPIPEDVVKAPPLTITPVLFPARNRTDFLKAVHDYMLTVPKKGNFLQYHQQLAHDYVLRVCNDQIRGILANHGMGAGKTWLGATICRDLLKANTGWRVIFLSVKSLHLNFEKTLRDAEKADGHTYTDEEWRTYLDAHYTFVSLNSSNMYSQMAGDQGPTAEAQAVEDSLGVDPTAEDVMATARLASLENTIVVCDEAHDFFNSVSHGSANALRLYRLIMATKRIRLLFLTGSPIVNDPFEIGLAYNMLAGYLDDQGTTLFGEDYQTFTRSFCPDNPDAHPEAPVLGATPTQLAPAIRNKEKFQNRIVGLTSTYHPSTAESKEAEAMRKQFPQRNEIHTLLVPMSMPQYSAYVEARDRERAEASRRSFKNGPMVLGRQSGGMTSTYRVGSRQLSNVLYPSEALDTTVNERGRVTVTRVPERMPDWAMSVRWDAKHDLRSITPTVWGSDTAPRLPTEADAEDELAPSKLSKVSKPAKLGKVSKLSKRGKGEDPIEHLEEPIEHLDEPIEHLEEPAPDITHDDTVHDDTVHGNAEYEIPDEDIVGGAVRIKPASTTAPSKHQEPKAKDIVQDVVGEAKKPVASPVHYGLEVWSPKVFLGLCYASLHLPWCKELDHFRAHAKKHLPPPPGPIVTGPGVIYSQFRESGIDIYARALRSIGFLDVDEKGEGPRFAIVSGEVDPALRASNVSRSSLHTNHDGRQIALLLVTATGAQGIDLQGFTHNHAEETYWHAARLRQFWARTRPQS
jgi:hypothetical protein